ncbi:MAG: pyridoxamine 5'-phosphate oxidase family protein [Acidimicrobiales bacterium]
MNRLTPKQIDFINAQPMFFVATAAPEGRVNVSPKGMDTLRVVDERRVVWLNLSGSGNETAAHVTANGRMTLMFMSITEDPLILRIYGTARLVHPRDAEWDELIAPFATMGGSRQIFDLSIESTLSSCGSGVPMMTVDAIRGDEALEPFYAAMSAEELHDYWARKNVTSIDGYPTRIFTD